MKSASRLFIWTVSLVMLFAVAGTAHAATPENCGTTIDPNNGWFQVSTSVCDANNPGKVYDIWACTDTKENYTSQHTDDKPDTANVCASANTGSSNSTTQGTDLTPTTYHAPQNSDYMFLNLEHSIMCQTAGFSPVPNQDCVSYNFQQGKLQAFNQVPGGGLMGGISNVMVAMYANPPTSSTQYLADLGSELGIVTPAYAQSVTDSSGGGVIQPILNIWQIMRNIAYLAFVLVFLVVGFMIMFRTKLSGQTVVNIQNALPGLVIGLFLVTFSYFISALIIDMSFVGMQVVAFIFKGLPNVLADQGSNQLPNIASNYNILDLMKLVVFNGTHISNIVGPVKDTFQNLIGFLKPTNPVGWFIGGPIGAVLGMLAMIVIVVAIVIQMFKLLWQLLQCYITLLITTIFSPLIILGASFPGRGGTLGSWWRPILANSLVFPVVFGAFLFAGMFLEVSNGADFSHTVPLFAGLRLDVIRTAIGYGIILATPGIPKMVKDALKAQDNPLGQVAQQGFQAGWGVIRGGARGGYEATGVPAAANRLRNVTTGTRARRINARVTGPVGQWVLRRLPG